MIFHDDMILEYIIIIYTYIIYVYNTYIYYTQKLFSTLPRHEMSDMAMESAACDVPGERFQRGLHSGADGGWNMLKHCLKNFGDEL